MAITLIGHTAAWSPNQETVTTSAIDSSGADLLVLAYYFNYRFSNLPNAYADSKGNTFTLRASVAYTNEINSLLVAQLFTCTSPIVGSGHTASAGIASNTTFPSVALSAWSGCAQTSPVDFSYGGDNQEYYPSSTIYGGGGTPSANGALIIAGATFRGNPSSPAYAYPSAGGGAFSVLDANGVFTNGTAFSLYSSVQTTATAVGLNWTHSDWISYSMGTAMMLALKAATGGAAFMPSAPLIVPQARKRAAFF